MNQTKKCPRCGEEMDWIDPYTVEHDNIEFDAWRGGWGCYNCDHQIEIEIEDDDDE